MEWVATIIASAISLVSSVIVAIIAYKGVCKTNKAANDKMQANVDTQQALFNERLENLTEEVRMHNNFARRLPVVEESVKNISSELHSLDKRVIRIENQIMSDRDK